VSKKELLHSGFLNSVTAFPDHSAVVVAGEALTYTQLFRKAASLAATIADQHVIQDPPLTAVFAYRSVTAYAGVLAALMLGHGYVPLNCTFPVDRSKTMLQRAGCRAMIVDSQSENQLDQLLAGLIHEMVVVLPERADTRELIAKWPMHRFIGAGQMVPYDHWRAVNVSPDSPAYILFTSGSTGLPKGVVVTHGNTRHYIDFIADRFSITQEDRFSQMFDMTFDLSVADMFVAWDRGACVCCPSTKMLIKPGRFINESGITVWFSVPSTAIFMKRLGSMKPGSYPGLRVSMFCGEALPVEVAKAWVEAAPNSIIENIYGPTELTIACMYYRWDADLSPDLCEMNLVPIGYSFPNMVSMVVDESLHEVALGKTGELLMAGPQVSAGYWKDPERTSTAFVVPPNKQERYYRTGDRVRNPMDGRPMTYIGRIDNQIKILGYRVELAEIEAVVREESGIEGVVAVGWPITPSGASGVEVFLQDSGASRPDLKERIAGRLPSYMVPNRFHFISQFPLNPNGKYDRKALAKLLENDNERV
jgi:amino acid adenylation domain-containing protein